MIIIKYETGKLLKDTIFTNDIKIGKGTKLEPGCVIYDNCEIGENCIIGANAVLRPHTKIGNNTIFGTASISEGYNKIGSYTTIHAQCHITQLMEIGDNVFIGPGFVSTNTKYITTGKHGNQKENSPNLSTTIIENNARIGGHVTTIPGVTIGHDSLVYQNTLITKDIPPWSIVKAGKDQTGKVIGSTKK